MSKLVKIIHTPKLIIYQDSSNEWRWTIKVKEDIVAASSEGYINREDCIGNILNVEKRIAYFRVNDLIK